MKDDTAFDWGTHTVHEGEETALALGPLQLHFVKQAGEIRVAYRREGEPSELHWSRWAPSPGWDGQLALVPALPDRPVVVKPENEFWLLKGSEARIYVRVPLHLRVEATGSSPRTLLRLPTVVLSDTWWGSPAVGELCYFLDISARRTMPETDFLEHLVICPLQLVNRSDDELLVTRIALRTDYLSIYRDGSRIWSDETRVKYRGDHEDSSLSVSGQAPGEATEATLMGEAEERMGRGFSARTFARIRSSLGWV